MGNATRFYTQQAARRLINRIHLITQDVDLLDLLKHALSRVLIAPVSYLAAGQGISPAFDQANTSPVWPLTGISIATILFPGLRV
jgi:hypothetical protein